LGSIGWGGPDPSGSPKGGFIRSNLDLTWETSQQGGLFCTLWGRWDHSGLAFWPSGAMMPSVGWAHHRLLGIQGASSSALDSGMAPFEVTSLFAGAQGSVAAQNLSVLRVLEA